VGSARLTCGQHPSQTPSAQVSPKREDLTQRSSRFGEAYFHVGLAFRLPGGLWSGAGVFGWRAGAWFPRLSCVGACLRLVVAVVLAGGDERGVRGRGWWILERVMDPEADWEATG